MTRAMRVLHCPTDTGGHPSGLSIAERSLGVESRVVVARRSWMGFHVDRDLGLGGRSAARRLLGRAVCALREARRHDVIHFNFGQSFLPRICSAGIDLPLLRAAGRTLFMTWQGCDARQTAYCRAHFADSCCGHRQGPGLCHEGLDAGKRRGIAFVSRFVHRMFCLNPDLLAVVPGAEFLPYASVDPDDLQAVPPTGAPGTIEIVHAPTSRLIKGTDLVESAVRTLQARGADIRLTLVEGLPRDEAMRLYRRADIIVDQMHVGWYGGFAVEAMAMAKPVVCFLRDSDLARIPGAMRSELPIVSADATSLVDVLASLVRDRAGLAGIGTAGRRFVERWHHPRRIAARMIELYRDPAKRYWDQPPGA